MNGGKRVNRLRLANLGDTLKRLGSIVNGGITVIPPLATLPPHMKLSGLTCAHGAKTCEGRLAIPYCGTTETWANC